MEETRPSSGARQENNMEHFISEVTETEIRREKERARELRKSQWWKRKCSEGQCYFCKQKIKPKDLTMDHIVPIIRGGKSTKGNVVPACKECNSKKKHMLPLEWQEYMDKIRREED